MEYRLTRSELLRARSRLGLARKGKNILKKRLITLMNEAMKRINAVRKLRREFLELYEKALKDVEKAEVYDGYLAVKAASLLNESRLEVSIEEGNVAGVKVPVIEYSFEKKKSGISPFTTSLRLYRAKESWEKVAEKAMEMAQLEAVVKKILEEIEKTRKRVNALEHKLIPELEEACRTIAFRLEEMEREDFARLKRIKG